METSLRVLIVEDSEDDALLIVRELERAGYEPVWERVERKESVLSALDRQEWDVVISDYSLPAFNGLEALRVLNSTGRDLPFLLVSGTVGEELAVEAMKAGAHDYLMKGNLKRLGPAIERELREVEVRRNRRRAEEALRRSEANYRSLILGATFGIFRCGVDGNFLSVNPALMAMLGYETESDLLAANLDRDIHCGDRGEGSLLDRYRKKGRIDGLLADWKRRDGKRIRVRLSGRAITGEGGVLEGFEIIAEDITEREQLEEQFRQAQKMESVGQLAGGVAHDFNNLMTIITGYARLLEDRLQADPTLRGYAHEITGAGERATDLTRQLLAFSRRQVLQPQVLDLNKVVAGFWKMLRRILRENIELATRPAEALGKVRADPGQIEQVLMNLVVNARDAMPEGGKVTLETANVTLDETYTRTHAAANPGDYVMLAVSDTGCGMDAEVQSHLFEPFFTTKERGKGTGLGLATVYGIVKQSGGNIYVYSEPGRGSTFKIYLPRVEGSGESFPAPTAVPTRLHGTETILLVEDEREVRRLVRGLLETRGYTVLDAPGAKEALELAQKCAGTIHLLLTDVVMPGTNGPELAERLKRQHPAIKILYISGYTGEAISNHGLLESGQAFLQKPFSPEALAGKVREVLDAPQQQAA